MDTPFQTGRIIGIMIFSKNKSSRSISNTKENSTLSLKKKENKQKRIITSSYIDCLYPFIAVPAVVIETKCKMNKWPSS